MFAAEMIYVTVGIIFQYMECCRNFKWQNISPNFSFKWLFIKSYHLFSVSSYQNESSKHDKSCSPFVPTCLITVTRNLIWKSQKHLLYAGIYLCGFSINLWKSRNMILEEEEVLLTKVDFWFSLTSMLSRYKVRFSRLDVLAFAFGLLWCI